MKLEPTAAQVEAVSDYIDRFRASAEYKSSLVIAQEIFAALNSIPDGAPVGTITRRPDGFWIAHMTESGWEYTELVTGTWRGSDADSWPQIRPDEWPDQAGLDWFPPGEEPLVPRPDPAASNTDAVPMSEPKGEMFGVILKALASVEFYGVDAPYLALKVHNALRAAGYDADPTAQQEPAYTVAAASEEMAKYWDNSIVTTTKREPRVVDRLGVDERGSRWHGAEGAAAYFHDGQSWRTNQGRVFPAGYQPDWNAPYTEILEPRVLPSLDCEEARDGTVWRDRDGDRCQYRDGLWWFVCDGPETWPIDIQGGRLTDYGPYVEVLS